MSDDLHSGTSRLVSICLSILIAAMALWGAVQIIRSVWVWLCVGGVVVGVVVFVTWLFWRQFRRW